MMEVYGLNFEEFKEVRRWAELKRINEAYFRCCLREHHGSNKIKDLCNKFTICEFIASQIGTYTSKQMGKNDFSFGYNYKYEIRENGFYFSYNIDRKTKKEFLFLSGATTEKDKNLIII